MDDPVVQFQDAHDLIRHIEKIVGNNNLHPVKVKLEGHGTFRPLPPTHVDERRLKRGTKLTIEFRFIDDV